MADFSSSKYLKAFDPNKPTTDRFNYKAFLADIGGIAEKTRKVTGPPSYEAFLKDIKGVEGKRGAWESHEFASKFPSVTTTYGGGKYAAMPSWWTSGTPDPMDKEKAQRRANIETARGAVRAYEDEYKAMEKQAGQAATALEMKGAATADTMQRLGGLSAGIAGREASAVQAYAAAGEKAEEYVQSARNRATASLARLDEIHTSIGEERDFAKAHAMSAAVQATIGSMNGEGRTIAERYGANSKEYQQWQGRKSTTLATINSSITADYQKTGEVQSIAHMNASTELNWKSDMYVNYQEQMHVETLMNMANYSQQYSLASAQLQVNIEQFRYAALDDIANWIVGTPSFTMDISPLVSLIGDLSTSYLPDTSQFRQSNLVMGGGGAEGGGGAKEPWKGEPAYTSEPSYGDVGWQSSGETPSGSYAGFSLGSSGTGGAAVAPSGSSGGAAGGGES